MNAEAAPQPQRAKHLSPSHNMRKLLLILAAAAAAATAQAQTLNWASPVFSDLADSHGLTLDGAFSFQIGVFADDFAPQESNAPDWEANWILLDEADYNASLGYFTSSAFLKDVPDYQSVFAGRNAYLWIRNGGSPEPGTEWFLGRAASWVLPESVPGCCGNGLPVEWSVSDLAGVVPDFGGQGGLQGPGQIDNPGSFTLQTATFVPEPSALALLALATALAARRRRGLP